MSYTRKKGRDFGKFFTDDEYAKVNEVCRRYADAMDGIAGMNLQYSSIKRFDAMCTAPAALSGDVASDLEMELAHYVPGVVTVGEARISDIGGGMHRVQVPLFPAR